VDVAFFLLLDEGIDSIPEEFKQQGEDWFAIFNKIVPRQFDVSSPSSIHLNTTVWSVASGTPSTANTSPQAATGQPKSLTSQQAGWSQGCTTSLPNGKRICISGLCIFRRMDGIWLQGLKIM
jgi:hypothetical protein